MGQKQSLPGNQNFQGKLSFLKPWNQHSHTVHLNPTQPIKFQYKTTRKYVETKSGQALNNLKEVKKLLKNTNELIAKKTSKDKITETIIRAKSEPNLTLEQQRSRRKSCIKNKADFNGNFQYFGYEIQDVESFLTRATLDKPANIPVVLAFPSTLYQTRIGGYQAEISLPLGMVVNAVFKNQFWLYVQTPHAEEGYVSYAACLPLGIIPMQTDDCDPSPCWEKSTDIFPKPSGNMTDTEKISSKSEYEYEIESDTESSNFKTYYNSATRSFSSSRSIFSTCGEKSVDKLYLRATAIAQGTGVRHTLLVINEDYAPTSKNGISVTKNEVVFLLNVNVKGWFYVKNKEGREGYIPAAVAGHGFL